MKRKRITQIFPWLMPIRKYQRLACFYMGMKFDREHYAATKKEILLPYELFESSCPLYNYKTGFDLVYQENKVFNLKLAAAAIDKLIILPNETFSFWKLVRYADKAIPYKDGLIMINGKLTTAPGGGLCQLSNLLYWMFLHSPLTIVERHGHTIKDFPDPPSDAPIGVDATVSEGWLDLKVKNNTKETLQIQITFDQNCINGRLLINKDCKKSYEVLNGKTIYYRSNDKIFEEVEVISKVISYGSISNSATRLLYKNKCEIGYQLPENISIGEKGFHYE
ncbi:vancomycin resistance protein VanW [Lachnotalea glycerini]|uniref:Vancomycin resistance protein VanW n=1 Tax=Lachnotalea glycerini TaxID=1763509 RepID=A0A318EVC9_9FIRM|nr:glycopeptide resistance accessory protein VanW [Lachnotalea glycerini]PXV89435.1 vancomycin resistance protein VanW [Lachnotalea glycerini]